MDLIALIISDDLAGYREACDVHDFFQHPIEVQKHVLLGREVGDRCREYITGGMDVGKVVDNRLSTSIYYGNDHLAKQCLDMINPQKYDTYLFLASSKGRLNVVLYILEKMTLEGIKLNPNFQLSLVANKGYIEILDAILDYSKNMQQPIAIDVITLSGALEHVECVKRVLKRMDEIGYHDIHQKGDIVFKNAHVIQNQEVIDLLVNFEKSHTSQE